MGYKDGTIRVWDIVKGTCEMVLTGHKGAVTAMAFNKTGSLLASGSTDTDIIVWDAVAETGLYRLKGHRDQVEPPFLSLMDSDVGWSSVGCEFAR